MQPAVREAPVTDLADAPTARGGLPRHQQDRRRGEIGPASQRVPNRGTGPGCREGAASVKGVSSSVEFEVDHQDKEHRVSVNSRSPLGLMDKALDL